ncbi:tyrosine-type recombinase/integrase [Mangrovimonas spongiae]|uniref:Site-specific integrase n=1 Tax=Mangrovimonas spongiae TaxID=2494697 RepID=A0A3R9N6X9_9FLAO|nr:site-specific integrase [Mangrovimonas spongiae]RSK40400.1 site-specific integrase [Mangrovimonas spongiae]
MSLLNDFITFEHGNEHDLEHDSEHDLRKKPQFSSPKIYNAKGDLSKRWYVYFSFRNPKTGKLERMKNIYGIANTYKKKEERLAVLSVYRKRLLLLLKKGYNPFEDNKHLLKQSKPSKIQKQQNEVATIPHPIQVQQTPIIQRQDTNINVPNNNAQEVTGTSLEKAFDLSLHLKKNVVGDRTLRDYRAHADKFISWLKEEHPNITTINLVDKAIIMRYLNEVLSRSSARNCNNYRTNLSSLMQTMEDNDIIPANHVKKIKALKTKPERNKTYSHKTQTEIFKYLEKEDPVLLLYIKFISYNFLRPIEVCRLKVKDINVKEGLLQFKSKNNPLEVKRIPNILLKDLPDLSQFNGDMHLFTQDKIGGYWDIDETNKRNHFSARYRKVVKHHFNLDKNYGLYSFRHTFITKLYQSLIKGSTPHEVKSKIMLITGHSTMDALEKYLRSIDAAIPDDYSHLLK